MRLLGDLVDPRLERDRSLGRAHPAQRGDEDLLGDVLRAAVVLDHADHVRVDPPLIARVEGLEGTIVAPPYGRDEAILVDVVCNDAGRLGDAAHSATTLKLPFPRTP